MFIYHPSADSDRPHDEAKSALRQLAESADTFDQVNEELVFGNSAGIGLLQEIHQASEWRRCQEQDIIELKRKNIQTERDIARLNNQVSSLQRTSAGYLDIRARFLDITKSDVLHLTPPDQRMTGAVRQGNKAAHEGDAAGDAYVYQVRSRNDSRVYSLIYGMGYQEVLSLVDAGATRIIEVLSTRATLLCQYSKRMETLPPSVEAAFNHFLLVHESNWAKSVEEPTSPLGVAYAKFWQAVEDARRPDHRLR